MTPLAQRLMGELIERPHKQRVRFDSGSTGMGSADVLSCKFFDTRKVVDVFPEDAKTFNEEDYFDANTLRELALIRGQTSDLCFSPAPRCWFETCDNLAMVALMDSVQRGADRRMKQNLRRDGVLSERVADDDIDVGILLTVIQEDGLLHVQQFGTLTLWKDRSRLSVSPSKNFMNEVRKTADSVAAKQVSQTLVMFFMLSLIAINSSRMVQRVEHMPGERDRQRSLRGRSLVGKFPLRAYTEVILTPGETVVPETREGGSTGQKAQHFVRAHLRRYANGKSVLVREHVRGDPALGMMQTRYKVQPK